MSSKELMHYEIIHFKLKLEFKNNFWDNNIKIHDLLDIKREKKYCYDTDQYIKSFIRTIKDKVIRNLPQLNKVEIKLGIIDKNNIWHRIMISSIEMLSKLLKIKKINFYKTIFVIIYYENNVVFNGIIEIND